MSCLLVVTLLRPLCNARDIDLRSLSFLIEEGLAMITKREARVGFSYKVKKIQFDFEEKD